MTMTRRTIGVAAGALLAGALLLGGAGVALARGMTAAPTGGIMGNGAGTGMMGGASGTGMMGGASGTGMMGGASGTGMMGGASGTGMMGNGSQPTAPYDLRFMDNMIMHHEGAIMSARMMISQSAHPELRDLARRIIAGQQAQVDQMRAWIRQWYPGKDAGPAGMGSGSGGMMGGGMMGGGMMGGGMMGGGMMGGDTSDYMFLRMMIPHHQIAIDMSRDALAQAQHPLLKGLARSIIRDQSAQITEMERYLMAWYGETSTRDLAGPMRGMMSASRAM